MNSNHKEPPKVPLIPASMHIHTQKPEHGWWEWTIEFLEESYDNKIILPWCDSGRERRHFETTLHCSDVFDPVPDLHWTLDAIKKDADFIDWNVDEEGKLFYMYVWNLDAVKVQLHVFTKCRDEDISWHFVMDRDAFIAELDAAYTSFGAQGGWGAY